METKAVEAEALRCEAEANQELPLPHPWLDPFILFLIFKFKFINLKKN